MQIWKKNKLWSISNDEWMNEVMKMALYFWRARYDLGLSCLDLESFWLLANKGDKPSQSDGVISWEKL